MNRRGFLGALFGVAAAASLGIKELFATKKITGWKVISSPLVLNENWYCVVHPDVERDIREMVAKEKWRDAFRQARIDRFVGSPQEILAHYSPAVMKGETGTVYGMKLISTAAAK